MRTSATHRTDAAPLRDSGYTLIEALVTLGIVGLLASVVVLAAPSPDRRVFEFAKTLAARLSHAGEESVITNRPIAFYANANGYGFAVLQVDGWRRVEGRSPLAFQAWPENMSCEVEGSAREAIMGGQSHGIYFTPVGDATPARIVLTNAGVRLDVELDEQGGAAVVRHE
jgi:type II secretion system protein H